MGLAVAHDLVRQGHRVTVADINERCLQALPSLAEAVDVVHLDAARTEKVRETLRGRDVAVSALPYDYNHQLARLAIEQGVHFCDLGGNTGVVEREMSLHGAAVEAGVTVVPDCGLAPGLTNVLAAHLIEEHGPSRLHIRVGGLPRHPRPPLNYQLVFSVHGLVNEYVEPARIIAGGEVTQVPSLTGLEPIAFESLPPLEAFYTSGGTSTLPHTFAGRLDRLDYRTIRYAGHCQALRLLRDLGFFDPPARPHTEEVLARALEGDGPDLVLARVSAAKGDTVHVLEMVDHGDAEHGLSAMMCTTGFPTAVIAQMLADGTIPERGVLTPERCVPPRPFLAQLRRRGLVIEERRGEPAAESGPPPPGTGSR